ncbi:hypothetical protein Tco_0771006 [Tanacetum coccineum]|uniref:Uncharacterized protein n=1 Tax=Tanacetum coccineum TaxID=301880 RepID=A0ABQ4ZET8_9ASTR
MISAPQRNGSTSVTAKKAKLNKQQPIPTTTKSFQSLFLLSSSKRSSKSKGERVKKDKGKNKMPLKETEEESNESSSDDTIHLTGFTVESLKKEIKESAKAEAAKHEAEIRKEELIDFLGLEVVAKYYKDKLQYDKYCDNMLNRITIPKITNYDILTRKGPIAVKVYREDESSEIIPNFKASDLHLGEWREVMEACQKRTRKGWTIIYKQIQTRMNYLHKTEVELGIYFNKPLSEQNPLDQLNDLKNKKRKHADDIHYDFRANKKLKSSVQYEDHLARTVMNEPVLGMIIFYSHHRDDFITIEDFRDL